MIGKKKPIKETNHRVVVYVIAVAIVICLTIILGLISSMSGSGIKSKEEVDETRETEDNRIILYTEPKEGDGTIPTAG